MKKQVVAYLLVLCLSLLAIPTTSLAKAKQMNDGVPVWNEETVKAYTLDFVQGNDLERLRGYYDLQIRRYMPMDTYQALLTEIEWMTGEFIDFGTYSSFAEPEQKTKTHVLHLCMEKQDLDLYFTHKDKEDDWEVMAVEFIPAAKQAVSQDHNALEGATSQKNADYTEVEVTVGSAPYALKGILTLPDGASSAAKVPACVLVHDTGPHDMDETIGQTKLFRDLANMFASKGIATLRYDKRTHTYGSSISQEDIDNFTVEEEVIQDAIAAGRLVQAHESINADQIVLLGHGLGAMLAPRIATEADKMFCAMILIAGTPDSYAKLLMSQNSNSILQVEDAQQPVGGEVMATLSDTIKTLAKLSEEEARSLRLFDISGYYFWEMEQHDQLKLIRTLKIPTYIVQGSEDFQVPVAQGIEAYEDKLGDKARYVSYKSFRGLNHMLMKYASGASAKGTVEEYNVPTKLDTAAGRTLVIWMEALWNEEIAEENDE